MIGEIFKALIITSLAGSEFALLVTLVRPITKKLFGYLWHYYVWIAVLLVMVMPVQFSIVKSEDINIPAAHESIQAEEFTQMQASVDTDHKQTETLSNVSAVSIGMGYIKKIADKNYFSIIWLAGMIMLLSMNIVRYIFSITRIRRNSVIITCPEIRHFTNKKITVMICRDISSYADFAGQRIKRRSA